MAKNTIKLKKYLDIIEEYPADAAILPGHLVELRSTGKVRKHSKDEGNALPMFALEDELQGKGIGDAYAEDDPVQVWVPIRGEMVLALLKDDENVAIGDFLCSAGDGTLKKWVALDSAGAALTETLPIVAQAVEAVNLSSSSGTYPATEFRIKVRIV